MASCDAWQVDVIALVYSTAEYALSIWYHSAHAKTLKATLNNTTHLITGCMLLTETTYLPVLAEIAPPDIRRKSRVMSLTTTARDSQDHLLHHLVSPVATLAPPLLKSRRLFSRHVAHLTDGFDLINTWNDHVIEGPRFINSACPPPSQTLPPGSDLPHKHGSG